MTCRRPVLSAVAMVAMIGLVASVSPASGGSCGEKAPSGKPNVTSLVGTIKSVDSETRTLVLTTGTGDEAKDLTMKVCPRAKILVNGKSAKLADVRAGATARVCHVKTKNGDLVAVRVAVGGGSCPGSSK